MSAATDTAPLPFSNSLAAKLLEWHKADPSSNEHLILSNLILNTLKKPHALHPKGKPVMACISMGYFLAAQCALRIAAIPEAERIQYLNNAIEHRQGTGQACFWLGRLFLAHEPQRAYILIQRAADQYEITEARILLELLKVQENNRFQAAAAASSSSSQDTTLPPQKRRTRHHSR